MISFKAFALTALLSISGVSMQEETYSLRYKVLPDDIFHYKSNLGMEFEGMKVSVENKFRVKVLKVEEDGSYEIEETVLEGLAKFNGEEQAMEASEPKKVKIGADGKRVKEEGDEDEDDLVSLLLATAVDFEPKAAVKIGDSWDIPGKVCEGKFKLAGKEERASVPCLKIEMIGKVVSDGGAGDVTGTVFLRAKDFKLIASELQVENFKQDPESPSGKFTFKAELTD
jgi:hypothetical protein